MAHLIRVQVNKIHTLETGGDDGEKGVRILFFQYHLFQLMIHLTDPAVVRVFLVIAALVLLHPGFGPLDRHSIPMEA